MSEAATDTNAAQVPSNEASDSTPAVQEAPGEGYAIPDPPPPADWREALDESIRGSKALENVQDVADLAKQFVNAQGLIGNSIRIPSENASDADRAAFRQKLLDHVPGLAEVAADDPAAFRATMQQLGAPSEATGYSLPELPDGLTPVPGFNEWAHEANLTQSQFNTIAERFTAQQAAQQQQAEAEHQAGLETLQREWGYAYDEKMANAANLAQLTDAPAEMVEALASGRISPSVLRWVANLADKFGEADIGADRRHQRGEMTPAEAQAQLDEIMGNKDHPYWQGMPGSDEKQRAIELVMRLKHRAMGSDGRGVAAQLRPNEYEIG